MITTRRLVRLHLIMLLVVLLPFTGYLWTVINHHPFVYLLAFVCLVLLICIESISHQTEREVKALQLRLAADRGDIAEWKEKVKELDRVVARISEENAAFRNQALEATAGAPSGTPGQQSSNR